MKAQLGSQLIEREAHRTIMFAAFCLVGTLVFCGMGLYPTYTKQQLLKQGILELQQERQVQKRLQPFLIALMTAEDAIKCSSDLVIVNKKPLPKKDMLDFDRRIIDMAEGFKLKADFVEVKVDEINRGDLVIVEAELIGDFTDFRRFLLNLGQVPWVHNFESLEIIGGPNQEQLKVEFMMALE